MIDSQNPEIPAVPSKLRNADERYETIKKRIEIMRGHTTSPAMSTFLQENQVELPTEYANDEGYWLLMLKSYPEKNNLLRSGIPDKNLRTHLATALAITETNKLIREKEHATTDKLTGLWSREALDNFLNLLLASPRPGTMSGLLLLDIDHFKEYNDTHGHTAGDDALRRVAKIMKRLTRASDMAARYGGEEFALIYPEVPESANASFELRAPNTNPATSFLDYKAEEIRTAIATDPVLSQRNVTVSIGTAPILGSTPKDVYDHADRNLYRAKGFGRNCSVNDAGKIEITTT